MGKPHLTMITVKENYTPEQAKAFVRRRDRLFNERLQGIADRILEKKDENGRPIRIVALAGPSCSGKTTAAKKLSEAFMQAGKNAITISIDDFYIERSLLMERAGDGEVDFDSPDTIDIEALSKCIDEIFDDDCCDIKVPVYDFVSGKSTSVKVIPCDPEGDDIYIFEGIQAFYPNVRKLFEGHGTASVFINVISGVMVGEKVVSGNKIRFLRRLVRDYARRDASAQLTFRLWKGVRANEEMNIYPNISCADYTIDSLLGYDIQMLRPYAEKILSELPADDKYSARAAEILDFIRKSGIIDSSYISSDSLFHEFI